MIQTTITIGNKLGIDARAASRLTQTAGRFPCKVHVSRNGRRVNGKSLMGVMMLAAAMGSEIVIETDGPEEERAMEALRELIEGRFGNAR